MEVTLIPAHAGVILRSMNSAIWARSYPRARGGDPPYTSPISDSRSLSPRTRG